MTDLELCKAIAAIEGIEVTEEYVGTMGDLITVPPQPFYPQPYDPLTDKAVLWDLTVKYKVEVDYAVPEVTIHKHFLNAVFQFTFSFDSIEDLPRTILKVIIKANADDK